MNPAELAAMSASGRKARNSQNSNGRDNEEDSTDELVSRRQPRRRRTVPAPKGDSPEMSPKKSETAKDAVEDDAE